MAALVKGGLNRQAYLNHTLKAEVRALFPSIPRLAVLSTGIIADSVKPPE